MVEACIFLQLIYLCGYFRKKLERGCSRLPARWHFQWEIPTVTRMVVMAVKAGFERDFLRRVSFLTSTSAILLGYYLATNHRENSKQLMGQFLLSSAWCTCLLSVERWAPEQTQLVTVGAERRRSKEWAFQVTRDDSLANTLSSSPSCPWVSDETCSRNPTLTLELLFFLFHPRSSSHQRHT